MTDGPPGSGSQELPAPLFTSGPNPAAPEVAAQEAGAQAHQDAARQAVVEAAVVDAESPEPVAAETPPPADPPASPPSAEEATAVSPVPEPHATTEPGAAQVPAPEATQTPQQAATLPDTAPAPRTSPKAAPNTAPVAYGMFGVDGWGDTSGYAGLVRREPIIPGAQRPYGGWFDEAVEALERAWPESADAIERVVVDRGELTLHVRRDQLVPLAAVLRDSPHLRFELCSSVSGVHYPDDLTGRPLHAVYHLTSLSFRRRIRVEVAVPDDDPHVPTVSAVWPTADWHERETWDLMGIVFDDHPGLTRIFMPDDWVGHPQRKDYPLGGIAVEYKGADIPPPDERRAYH